jgi:hypothetical protein
MMLKFGIILNNDFHNIGQSDTQEEIATKLYDKDVRDVRELIHVMKIYSIQKTKTVGEVFEFLDAYGG